MGTFVELKGEATNYSFTTVWGRTLYNGVPVVGAALVVDGSLRGYSDSNGIFAITIPYSTAPRSWSIVGWSGSTHVGASGVDVLSGAGYNAGDVALSQIA